MNYANPYRSTRHPVFARNVVATSHPLAAQAGLRILGAGGNAVDAAIAAAAAMTIVEPCSNGLGSDAFALVWDRQQLHGLNASGPAPAAWTPAYFDSRHGQASPEMPKRGVDSITVPGAVSAWATLSERFGRLTLAEVLAPAIEIAERGFIVPVVVQQKWAAAAALTELTSQPGFSSIFLPRGRAPHVGEVFRLPTAALALKLIAQTNGDAFYRGEIADAIVGHVREHGGALSAADLAAFQPEWVEPLALEYRSYTLHEIPPNGQGIAAQMAAGILQHFDMAALPVDSVESVHLQIEAMKLAFADAYRFVSDPASMTLSPADLLNADYLAERARLIDPQRAQDFQSGNPVRGGTVYITAADERGMMVSLIQSNYMGFGSGVVEPTFGISLQNRGNGFSRDAASPNVVAPGKRPFHTIIPAFLSKGGRPVMSFGIMGGHMQPQAHLQAVVRMVDHRQSPQAACDAPRWRFNQGLSINVESHMDPAVVQGLSERGHRIEGMNDSYMDFGAGQYIFRLDEGLSDGAERGYVAASDPRRDGAAVGF